MANLTDPTATKQSQVDAVHGALRVAARPLDHGALGQYLWGGFTGILPAALGVNSEIFQFRNPVANLVLIRRVKFSAIVSTTMFAAGVPVQIDMVRAASWTVQGTGGTGVAPAALLKKRNSMANSGITSGDIRSATTAALGAGTKTLEGASVAALMGAGPITGSLNGEIIPPGSLLFEVEMGDGDYPFVLAQNEGFVIRSVAVPATGTWSAAISVEWMEMVTF